MPPPPLAALGAAALAIGGVNLGGFALTAATKTHKVTDLCGVGAFAGGAAAAVAACKPAAGLAMPAKVGAALLGVWSVRLGGYLFRRVCVVGEDARLKSFFPEKGEPMLTGPSRFPLKLAGFWTIQATWAVVVGAPVYLLASLPTSTALSPVAALGFAAAALGLALEAKADADKARYYARTPKARRRWCASGVWRLSRHPNYVGECVFWSGVSLASLAHLSAFGAPASALAFAAASPALTYVLVRHVSGVPLLEAGLRDRFAADPTFAAYLDAVPVFWPTPASVRNALRP